MFLKIKTFIKSLFFHIYAGLPKSSREEISERYSICLSCDLYDNIKEECQVCGCSISNKSKFMNKLAWADQECPVGKWSKINATDK
jgi:hypothetical protein